VWLFGRLKHSLQLLLATQADIQLRELPNFCHKSDELLLSFNNWRTALAANFQSEMTADQLSCIDAIQQAFVRMGRESWTNDAVSNSLEWKKNPSVPTENSVPINQHPCGTLITDPYNTNCLGSGFTMPAKLDTIS
jgi:hypothetical protein